MANFGTTIISGEIRKEFIAASGEVTKEFTTSEVPPFGTTVYQYQLPPVNVGNSEVFDRNFHSLMVPYRNFHSNYLTLTRIFRLLQSQITIPTNCVGYSEALSLSSEYENYDHDIDNVVKQE